MYRSMIVGALLLALAGTAGAHSSRPAAEVAPAMTRALAEYPGKEVVVLTVVYPPGGGDPVHRHDAHGFIYVLEGAIVMGVRGGEAVTLGPGDTFYESPDDIHTVGHNASSTEPVRFLVFLLKQQDKPVFVPVD